MNSISLFRLCTLTDDELLSAVDKETDQMYKTGKIPYRQIPARPNEDFDLCRQAGQIGAHIRRQYYPEKSS